MPKQKKQVKNKTSLNKIKRCKPFGRSKSTELSTRGSVKNIENAPQVLFPFDNQQRRGLNLESLDSSGLNAKSKVFVPVVGLDGRPLMPTKASRARKMLENGRAIPFFIKGFFVIKMVVKTGKKVQPIAIGIDPGSKMEGYTVMSEFHTYLNTQCEAIDWVKKTIEARRNARKVRRYRNTPCRKNKYNRSRGGLPPSTKARWDLKLRMARALIKLFPVIMFVVEDIQAKTKEGQRKWNKSFSPLECGKKYFYEELGKLGQVITKQGWETKELRDLLGLKKSKAKLDTKFECHCVDSFVLAYSYFNSGVLDNKNVVIVKPLQFHRRQLHVFQPSEGGIRRTYGSTVSLGIKRGTLIKHPKHGIGYVGGNSKGRISLHSLNGNRLTQNAKVGDCKILNYSPWTIQMQKHKKPKKQKRNFCEQI